MTQQALADSVGVTRQTVIALEKGKYYPSLELAFLIAKRFGLPLEDVFQFESEAVEKSRGSGPAIAVDWRLGVVYQRFSLPFHCQGHVSISTRPQFKVPSFVDGRVPGNVL